MGLGDNLTIGAGLWCCRVKNFLIVGQQSGLPVIDKFFIVRLVRVLDRSGVGKSREKEVLLSTGFMVGLTGQSDKVRPIHWTG